MSYKVEVKKGIASDMGGHDLFEVKMKLTQGELLALRNLVRNHDTSVGSDLCAMFANALLREGIYLP